MKSVKKCKNLRQKYYFLSKAISKVLFSYNLVCSNDDFFCMDKFCIHFHFFLNVLFKNWPNTFIYKIKVFLKTLDFIKYEGLVGKSPIFFLILDLQCQIKYCFQAKDFIQMMV